MHPNHPRTLGLAAAGCALVGALALRLADPHVGWALPAALAALGLLAAAVLWRTRPARLGRALVGLWAAAVALALLLAAGAPGGWPLVVGVGLLYGTIGYALVLAPAGLIASFVALVARPGHAGP